MGCGERAKRFTVAKEDSLASLDLCGEEDVDTRRCLAEKAAFDFTGSNSLHSESCFASVLLNLIAVLMLTDL